MKSSYLENNYGEVFRSIITAWHPITAVELGVLHGYSTVNIAEGLRQLGRGHLDAYDLFEDYPYNHSNMAEVQAMINDFGLASQITLHKADAREVHLSQVGPIDLLHVDLSNDADTIRWVMEKWDPLIVQGGSILFEGGTEERDGIEWMKQYDRPAMKQEFETNKIITDKYIFGTYLKFPGLTHLLKKRY